MSKEHGCFLATLAITALQIISSFSLFMYFVE